MTVLDERPGVQRRHLKIPAIVMFFCVLLISAHPCPAYFFDKLLNPEVEVTITHPPQILMNFERVAFGPAKGDHSDEFVDALIEDFIQNNIEVMDREHLNSILSEHNFSLSGHLDRQSAVRLGQMLGPAVLIFVKVQRCVVEKDDLTGTRGVLGGGTRTVYISRTRASFKASVRMVELTTGNIYSARTIEKTEEAKNESMEGRPEHPDKYVVMDRAIDRAVTEVHRMIFPWSATRSLIFYDDKAFDLKRAHSLLIIGDLEGCHNASKQSLIACRKSSDTKPKTLCHAYYNVGMTFFLMSDYESALKFFKKAHQVKATPIVQKAIADCEQARSLAADVARVEDQMAMGDSTEYGATAPTGYSKSPPAATRSTGPSGNQSIEQRLKKLRSLRDKGLLSESEYREKKAEILEDL